MNRHLVPVENFVGEPRVRHFENICIPHYRINETLLRQAVARLDGNGIQGMVIVSEPQKGADETETAAETLIAGM